MKSQAADRWKMALTVGCLLLCFVASPLTAAEPGSGSVTVKHPNLLLNQEEIDQIKTKIRDQPWAARLLELVKAKAQKEDAVVENALVYVLTGSKEHGERAKNRLLREAREQMPYYAKLNIHAEPEWGRWSWWGATAWAYDLIYDLLSPKEQTELEHWLRTAGKTMIAQEKVLTTTPNLVFCQHWRVGMIGYAIGDSELIEYALNDPGAHGPSRGGFYQVMDSMIRDEHFWAEAPIYALHYDVHGMFALAEAALRHDGTDLYKFVAPKSGATLKKIVDGYLRMAFPVEDGPGGKKKIRLATFGDGSTGVSMEGKLTDTFLDESFMAVLELAYKRYQDEGYAWMLGLNPARASYIRNGRPAFSYVALTHGDILPEKTSSPSAASGIYPSMGFAVLRSDESPHYWSENGLTAVMRLGTSMGHGHADYFSLILHGKGQLLYPDLNVMQYEPRWLNWTAEGIAHSTLLIDHESPSEGKQTLNHEFTPEVKFFAIKGSAFNNSEQERALLLTDQYLLDLFKASDTTGEERTFDWVVHGLGRLYPGNPGQYTPSSDLLTYYGWIDNERSRTHDGAWQADWIQSPEGVKEREGTSPSADTGVRVTVLGSPGTRIYTGEGPLVDSPPHHRLDGHIEPSLPLLLVRRKGKEATYAAIHEPYTRSPSIKQIEVLQQTGDAIALKVKAEKFEDRLFLNFGPAEKTSALASKEGESFQLTGYGYLRLAGTNLIGRGRFNGFSLRVKDTNLVFTLNGKTESVTFRNGFAQYGTFNEPTDLPAGDQSIAPEETKSAVHAFFLPEEVRLKSGGSRDVSVTLRSVGQGKASGKLRLKSPDGITVVPEDVDLSMGLEGGTVQTIKLQVSARAGLPAGLHQIRIEPLDGLAMSKETLRVSVGVVLKKDRRYPRLAQWVARSPAYTMKVDEFSGVGTYLLDSEGHRRFGRFSTGNFIYGFGAVEHEDDWLFRLQQASHQSWSSPSSLTFLGEGKLQWDFKEDRIVIKYVNPQKANRKQTMWLGNFDKLESPLHDGEKRENEATEATWLFFPHAKYKEGVLLRFGKKTSVKLLLQRIETVGNGQSAVEFPVMSGDEVSLAFATRESLINSGLLKE